jgi:hypothetical protein
MKTDDFEKRLQQIAPREIPPVWRDDILAAAQAAKVSHRPTPAARPHFFAALAERFAALTRMQRAAWAGLATIWLLIAGLNLSARDHATSAIAHATLPSAERLQALRREKLQLLAELADQRPPATADRPKVAPPRPHSRREANFHLS